MVTKKFANLDKWSLKKISDLGKRSWRKIVYFVKRLREKSLIMSNGRERKSRVPRIRVLKYEKVCHEISHRTGTTLYFATPLPRGVMNFVNFSPKKIWLNLLFTAADLSKFATYNPLTAFSIFQWLYFIKFAIFFATNWRNSLFISVILRQN